MEKQNEGGLEIVKILLDIKKIKKTGWIPKKTIKESIHETVEYFKKNDWVFK